MYIYPFTTAAEFYSILRSGVRTCHGACKVGFRAINHIKTLRDEWWQHWWQFMKKMLLVIFILIAAVTFGVQAQESEDTTTEIWRCFDLVDFWKEYCLN